MNGCVAVLALLAMAATLLFTLTRTFPDVPLNLIEGRYRNPCCDDIVIREKYLEYGAQRVGYSAERMKYGTELTPDRAVGQFYLRDIKGRVEVGSLVLTRKGKLISLNARDFRGHDYTFKKDQ